MTGPMASATRAALPLILLPPAPAPWPWTRSLHLCFPPAPRRWSRPAHLRLRAALVSISGTAVDFALFSACTLVLTGGPLLATRWLCAAVGGVLQFWLNRRWAFCAQDDRCQPQLAKFALTASVSITLSTLVWWVLCRTTGWDPRLMHLLAPAVVWIGFTFPVLRGWVFGCSSRSTSAVAPRS